MLPSDSAVSSSCESSRVPVDPYFPGGSLQLRRVASFSQQHTGRMLIQQQQQQRREQSCIRIEESSSGVHKRGASQESRWTADRRQAQRVQTGGRLNECSWVPAWPRQQRPIAASASLIVVDSEHSYAPAEASPMRSPLSFCQRGVTGQGFAGPFIPTAARAPRTMLSTGMPLTARGIPGDRVIKVHLREGECINVSCSDPHQATTGWLLSRVLQYLTESGDEDAASQVVALRCCSPRRSSVAVASSSKDWLDALLQDGDRPLSFLPEGLQVSCVYSSPTPHLSLAAPQPAAAAAAGAPEGTAESSLLPVASTELGNASQDSEGLCAAAVAGEHKASNRPLEMRAQLQLPPSQQQQLGTEQPQVCMREDAPSPGGSPSWHSQDGDTTASTLSAGQRQHSSSSSGSSNSNSSSNSYTAGVPRARGLLPSPFPTSSPLRISTNAKYLEVPPGPLGAPPPTHELRCCLCCFSFERQIGRGGFSRVFRARSSKSGKLLAVKVIKKEKLEGDPQRLRRALAEREVMASCQSPFILQLLCSFQTEKELFLVTDFCPGGDLAALLRCHKRFSEDVTRFVAVEVLLGLQHLQKQRVVYRDLKAANVLVDLDGHCRLADFGLAKKLTGQMKRTYSFCGSPEYLSPEMLLGTGHDQSLDLYALGCLIFELLVGVPPFFATNRNVMYIKIMQGRLSFPASCQVSQEVQSLVSRLLCLEPLVRIGASGGVEEVMRHKWFSGVCWNVRGLEFVVGRRDALDGAPFACDTGLWNPGPLCPFRTFDWTNASRLEDLAAREVDFCFDSIQPASSADTAAAPVTSNGGAGTAAPAPATSPASASPTSAVKAIPASTAAPAAAAAPAATAARAATAAPGATATPTATVTPAAKAMPKAEFQTRTETSATTETSVGTGALAETNISAAAAPTAATAAPATSEETEVPAGAIPAAVAVTPAVTATPAATSTSAARAAPTPAKLAANAKPATPEASSTAAATANDAVTCSGTYLPFGGRSLPVEATDSASAAPATSPGAPTLVTELSVLSSEEEETDVCSVPEKGTREGNRSPRKANEKVGLSEEAQRTKASSPNTGANAAATTEAASPGAEEPDSPTKAGTPETTSHSEGSCAKETEEKHGRRAAPLQTIRITGRTAAGSLPVQARVTRASCGKRYSPANSFDACALRSVGSLGGTVRADRSAHRGPISSVAADSNGNTSLSEAEAAHSDGLPSSSSEKGQRARKAPALPRVACLGSQRRVPRDRAPIRSGTSSSLVGNKEKQRFASPPQQSSPSLRARAAASKAAREAEASSVNLASVPRGHTERAVPMSRPSAAASVRVTAAPSPGAALANRKREAEAKHAAGQGKARQPVAAGGIKGISTAALK